MSERRNLPLVVITGAAGAIGSAVAAALADDYRIVGIDRDCAKAEFDCIEVDLTDASSIDSALGDLRRRCGDRIAAVLHLAAYFDFTGEPNPLYEAVNVDGTTRLLQALQAFDVEQFLYASTMLVHRACAPGERIDEDTPLEPKWAYPESKARAEQAIAEHHGRLPYVLLRFAGLYDDHSAVPTLTQQIARIYARDFTSHVYAGDMAAGQSMVHREDLIDAIRRSIDRRAELPSGTALLVGEPDAMGYGELQDALGTLIHGESDWATLRMPAPLAKAGAWLQSAAEPLIPDAIDHGEKPFIQPFMIDMASDHYALDIGRARRLLGWQPRHRLARTLPKLVAALKRDPRGWYRENGISAPRWVEAADDEGEDPERLRRTHQAAFEAEHQRHRWARAAVAMLGVWLLSAPLALPYDSRWLLAGDVLTGGAALVIGLVTLSWRFAGWRLLAAALGAWLLLAPLVFWTGSPAVYLNATLVGGLMIAFALAVPPWIGVSPLAARRGPDVPPGWDLSPSSWSQRAPIIALAFVGLAISRALAAYQLGHVDAVWDPLFGSDVPGRNGTEAIITSDLSEAWPLPDAGVGAVVYLLEIVIGLTGAANRWRTMPWLVLAFGALIVPLGAVSIGFIIIQPILLGTWCTLCLIAAAAMLAQIPFALNELLATLQFLARRRRAGQSLLLTLFRGDTDDSGAENGRAACPDDELARAPRAVLADMLGGGVALPWNLALCIAIGLWLMLTRLTLGHDGALADAEHLIGALVITVSVIACAEVARSLRWVNGLFAIALLVLPFVFAAGPVSTLASVLAGLMLGALSLRRGAIRHRWGAWNRWLV
jgi:nucleoside-diphosphate-sugar epimerase/uncharacterized membrane protein